MSIRLAFCACLTICTAHVACADALQEAAYATIFNRAQALVPGRTTLEKSPARAGAVEIVNGRRVQDGEGITIEAEGNQVEVIWNGRFDRDLRRVKLSFEAESEVPVRVLPYVYRLERFDRADSWSSVKPDGEKTVNVKFKGENFAGFKLVFNGKGLAGKKLVLKQPLLSSFLYEGFFRREIVLPEGAIWEAVAEVGNMATLWINGKRVDDDTVVLPRPHQAGGKMYQSLRVPLKAYLKPGKNVLGMYVMRHGYICDVYLRGSVVMESGERVLLDTGTDWTWSREAAEGWAAPGFDDSDWSPVPAADERDTTYRIMSRKSPEAVALPATKFHFSYRRQGELPCYDGRIKLRNPVDRKLFLNSAKPFALDVHLPGGLADAKPVLTWQVHKWNGKDGVETIADGKTEAFRARGNALVGSIDGGSLEPGVYVLTARLSGGDEVIEDREPEPFVVTGKVRMQETAGDSWEQGMDLDLEDIIDFTDPDDPHPWFETDRKGLIPRGPRWGTNFVHTVDEPLIVERNGLRYRVTRPVYTAQFSYKVEFEHPGDWYLMVLEYPDDAERWIGVSCNASSRNSRHKGRADASSKCGPGIWTGGKYPVTGDMLEMKWIYRPDPGPHAINVMSLMKDTEAAVSRLRIYHVKGPLPALNTGDRPVAEQRRFGMLTERTAPYRSGIYNLFSSFEVLPSGAGRTHTNAVFETCIRLQTMQDAARHYAEYLRYAGQNLHVMGSWQYNDKNTCPQYITGDPRLHYNARQMLSRVLQANGIQFYASVEFRNTWGMEQQENPEWFFVPRDGTGGPIFVKGAGTGGYNFMHPHVEREMLRVARQLALAFTDMPHFLGINWTAYFGGSWIPSYRVSSDDPLHFGYGDFTIGLFETETGIRIPVPADDPARYEKRYQYLTGPDMKARWQAWRAEKLAGFFRKVRRTIKSIRPDLEVVAGCYTSADHIKEWQHQKVPLADYLGQWGWAPESFKDEKDLWLMPWLHANARHFPAFRNAEYAMAWQGNKDPRFYEPFASYDKRALMLCIGWHEVERIAANYPVRPGWPRPYQQTMMAQQREEFAMEAYTQAMIGMDPQMIMFGFTDVSPYIGVENMQQRFSRVLRRLPMERFERVLETGFDTDLAMRALRESDRYLFYVANPGYWPVAGQITVDNAGAVRNLVTGDAVELRNSAMEVALPPFGLAAFYAGADAGITAWKTDPVPEAELAHIRQILADAKTAAANPLAEGFLGAEDFAILKQGVAVAEDALKNQHVAKAWDTLTDAFFWTVAFQKIPEMKFADIVKPRAMKAVRYGRAPEIDGVLNDDIWKRTKAVDHFVTMNKEYSDLKTWVRVARKNSRLCIAFECLDPEPDKIRAVTEKEDEKRIWETKDDLVDFFIVPDEELYYQFAVNAGGVRFDQKCSVKGLRDYDYSPAWKSAVRRSDKGWTVEVEIDTREAFGKDIRDGDVWKVNFHRAFRLGQKPMSSWVYSPSWHSQEHMGTVKFVELGH